jgi:cobalt/nickel transport system permease protein
VTHLHLPDGALPWWLWAPGLVAAALLLVIISRRHRHDRRDRLALIGSLSALMLAAMSLPLGPLGYHLSLAPVVGIVLGGGLAFVAACVVNTVLALLGHGGITVVGLNAIVTGTAAALGGAAYRALAWRLRPFWAAAWGAVAGMAGSLVLWLVIVGVAGTTPNPGFDAHEAHGHARALAGAAGAGPGTAAEAWTRLARVSVLSLPFWMLGTLTEALVAGGVIGFLARVKPDLLARPAVPGAGASARSAT